MLQKLFAPSNRLERVEMAAFCGLDQLVSLNLGYNKLSSAPNLCPMKCSLEILYLESNRLSTISKSYFKGLKKIRMIVLDNNKLIQLPDLHWVQHSLTVIRVAGNYLTSFEALQTFDIYKHLSNMYMSNNTIRNFNVTLLRHMPKLTNLVLFLNNITHVDDFRGFYDKKINLMENPWHGGEALSWMGEEDMEFENGLTCATPVCLRNMTIADMSKLSIT